MRIVTNAEVLFCLVQSQCAHQLQPDESTETEADRK